MSQGLCPNCGAAVNFASDQIEIKCKYCESLVRSKQAEVQLGEVKNSKFGGTLLIAETAQEGGSYEEALNYYNKVIEQEPTFSDAWLNKGICAVRASTIGNLKIPEAISSWKAAIKFAKHPEAMKKRVAKEIAETVSTFYPVLERHYEEFKKVQGALSEHFGRFLTLVSALSFAQEMDAHNELVAELGYGLCKRLSKTIVDALSFFSARKYTTKLDALAVGFQKVLQETDPQAYKIVNAKIEAKRFEEEIKKHVVAIWVCRILGPVGLLGAIGMLWNAISGNKKPDEPGVGGSIATLLLCAGMTLCWFSSGKKAEPSETKIIAKKDEKDGKPGGMGSLLIVCIILLPVFASMTIAKTSKALGLMETTQEPSELIFSSIFFSVVSMVLIAIMVFLLRKPKTVDQSEK